MLEINDLTLQYPADYAESGNIRVLDGVSFHLRKGESIGIIGESGSGKTSLGIAVMGLSAGEVSGEIRFGGVNLLDLADEEMRVVRWNKISMVMQNTGNVLNPAYTVEQQITEPITKHGLDSKIGVRKRASLLLREVGLNSDKLNAYPVELSGGERQQVLIAMALANDPELIIMDEPTASLDVLTRKRILGLLDRIKEERSLLVISHDASTVASLENLIVLYSGRVMEAGKTDLLLKDPTTHTLVVFSGRTRSWTPQKTCRESAVRCQRCTIFRLAAALAQDARRDCNMRRETPGTCRMQSGGGR